MKGLDKRKIMIAVMMVLVALVAGMNIWDLLFDPYNGTVDEFVSSRPLEAVLSPQKALEDLDFMVHRIEERHPAAVSGLPQELAALWRKERSALAAKPAVSVLELWQSSAKVLAALHDGHTGVRHLAESQREIPVQFGFRDGRLTASSEHFQDALVVNVGGIPAEELYQRFKNGFSSELDAYTRYNFLRSLNRQDCLAFLGIPTDAAIALEVDQGTGGWSFLYGLGAAKKMTEPPTDFVSYTIDETASTGYLTLLSCQFNDLYRDTLKAFFRAVKEKGIQSVVVDLRSNPGGNSLVTNEFIRYLPVRAYRTGSAHVRYGPLMINNKAGAQRNQRIEALEFSGDVYILTSTYTFSSAVDFAVLIQDNGLGKIVGESPGNMPTSCGDILTFQTPNSKLYFSVSFKHFIRPDVSKSALPLLPDVPVPAGEALERVKALVKTRAQGH